MIFGFLVAHPLPVGHRLDFRVMRVSEKIGCRGASEPNGAVHVDEKVVKALY